MANSAFDHSPKITVPGSSTNTAIVRWSGTGGTTFLDSTLLLSTSATPTLGIAADTDLLTFGNGILTIAGSVSVTQVDIIAQGDLRLQDNSGGEYIAFDSPATVSTSYTVTMPAGLPVAEKVLKVTSISSNVATMEWGTAGASQTPWTGNIDGGNYTLSNVGTAGNDWTANSLVVSSGNSTANQIMVENTTASSGAHAKVRIKVADGGGDAFIDFTEAGSGEDWSIGLDQSASEFKICKNTDLQTGDVFVIGTSGNIGIGQAPETSGPNPILAINGNFMVRGSNIQVDSSQAGATTQITVYNPSTTSGSQAYFGVQTHSSAGGTADPYIRFDEAGIGAHFKIGIDNDQGDRWVISAGTQDLGHSDAIRISQASAPVVTYNATHPTGTFDYVCEVCGDHGPEPFVCHSQAAEWHDDVLDFRALVLRQPGAVEYMERVGVIEQTFNNDGELEIFARLGPDWMFVGAMAYQNRNRMDFQYEELKTIMQELKAEIDILKG